MASLSANTTLKVNRAISGADTVSANAYAIITYVLTAISGTLTNQSGVGGSSSITRYFGPGQSIPASFVGKIPVVNSTPQSAVIDGTFTLQSGVEFINTP